VVKVGILGLGVVGCGTLTVLRRNYPAITSRAGTDIQVIHAAVRQLNKNRPCDTDGIRLTEQPLDVVTNPEVDVVIELMGGIDIARECVMTAMQHGKSVITANKALLANHGNELFREAAKLGVSISFEAAVAGGIPIIKAIREALAGNRIQSITGILNGTCNYMLTQMAMHGTSFADCLAEAQANGYAEADPTMDIDGFDVAHKLAILAALAFDSPLQLDEVSIEGIRLITPQDIVYAAELGYTIKHIGQAIQHPEGLECRVHPALIPAGHTLAHVNNAMNAVLLQSDALGESLYYGAGAGAEPTASAVLADLIQYARGLALPVPQVSTALPIMPASSVVNANYLRLQALDKPGVLADITRIFGDAEISIESIMQRQWEHSHGKIPIVIVTHPVSEARMQQALKRLEELPDLAPNLVRIRLALNEGGRHGQISRSY